MYKYFNSNNNRRENSHKSAFLFYVVSSLYSTFIEVFSLVHFQSSTFNKTNLHIILLVLTSHILQILCVINM